MIIYGSRMYGRGKAVKTFGLCDNCGKYCRNISYNSRKWGHIYFIPLIPQGVRMRVLKQCTKCSQGIHLPLEHVPAQLEELQGRIRDGLMALLAGQQEVVVDGVERSAEAMLAGTVEMLHCLGASDQVALLLASLKSKALTHAHDLVEGESLEVLGKLAEAELAYRRAAESRPEDGYGWICLGMVRRKKNDMAGAKESLERALPIARNQLSVRQLLLSVYEGLKDYPRLAETYEACFQANPGLWANKQVLKAYKSACKKGGREPIVSAPAA